MNARTLEIPFASHKHAQIARQAIEVDAELQPQAVNRTLEVRENMLIAYVTIRTMEPKPRLTICNAQDIQYPYNTIGPTDSKCFSRERGLGRPYIGGLRGRG